MEFSTAVTAGTLHLQSSISALKTSNSFLLVLLLCITFAGLFLFSARFGTVILPQKDFFDALFFQNESNLAAILVWEIRIPRFLTALLCGGSLALCGQLLQLLVNNPLAEPYTLGTGAGASLGMQMAVTGILPVYLSGTLILPIWAFAGAMAAGICVLVLSGKNASGDNNRMLLAGIAVSILCGSLISFISYFHSSGNQLRQMIFWSFGSLDKSSWQILKPGTFLLLPAILVAFSGTRRWNLLLLGSEKITSLGYNPGRIRQELLLLSSFITALVVCLAGPIGFVGLVVPYCIRHFIPLGHNGQLLITFSAGALFLAACDLIPRFFSSEIPVPTGLISSLIGLPLFLYLLRKSTEKGAV